VPGLSISYFNTDLTSASYLPFWPLYTGGAYQGYLAFGGGNRFVYYFLLKQGPIAGDVLTAGLLYRVVGRARGNRALALKAAAFWSFFPYAIVISALWGQFDSLAVAIVLASLLVTEASQKNVLYGVGIFVKWITAMFLPFEVFRRRGTARLWVLAALAVPLALTGLVFLAFHWSLTGVGGLTLVESGGVGGGMNWARWFSPYGPLAVVGNPPLATDLFESLWIPGVVVAGWLAARNLTGRGWAGEVDACVGIVATFLLLRWGLNEQYLLYLFAPLVVDVLACHPERRALSASLVVFCTFYLVLKNTLLVPFAAPLGPQYVAWVNAANNTPGWDPLRLWTLNALAILITISLAQLAYVALSQTARPRPWLFDLARVVRRGTGRAPVPAQRG